jgi:hypothetical protein
MPTKKMRHEEVNVNDPAFQCALARAQGNDMEAPKKDSEGNIRTRRQAATAVLDYTNYINYHGLDDVLARHGLKRRVVVPERAPTHSAMAGASA